jgi:hypothetical protein
MYPCVSVCGRAGHSRPRAFCPRFPLGRVCGLVCLRVLGWGPFALCPLACRMIRTFRLCLGSQKTRVRFRRVPKAKDAAGAHRGHGGCCCPHARRDGCVLGSGQVIGGVGCWVRWWCWVKGGGWRGGRLTGGVSEAAAPTLKPDEAWLRELLWSVSWGELSGRGVAQGGSCWGGGRSGDFRAFGFS